MSAKRRREGDDAVHGKTADSGAGSRWDDTYGRGEANLSWYQPYPAPSLRMIAAAAVDSTGAVIDVGGGASHLVDALLDRDFVDVTVLDISAVGIEQARQRLGARAARVEWLVEDVLAWRPTRRYDVWHDRAVFHFLTSPAGRAAYLTTIEQATHPRSIAIFGTFAPDGPTRCSGLPVARYGPDRLAATLGSRWHPIASAAERHTTPGGAIQPFTWVVFSRTGGDVSSVPP